MLGLILISFTLAYCTELKSVMVCCSTGEICGELGPRYFTWQSISLIFSSVYKISLKNSYWILPS